MRTSTPSVTALALLLALAVVAGCGSTDSSVGDTSPAVSPSTDTSSADTSSADTSLTDAPTTSVPSTSVPPTTIAVAAPSAEDQLNWFVEIVNTGEPPTIDVLSERFAPAFADAVPLAAVVEVVSSLTAGSALPFRVDRVQSIGRQLEALIVDADGAVEIIVTLSVDGDGQIDGLLLQPAEEPSLPDQISPTELDEGLAELAAESALGVYEIAGGDCLPVHERDADRQLAVGSVFKLWVLAELGRQIDAGEAAWDETLPITDGWRSTPDGELVELPAGTPVTLRQYAELMISISDNTATDHLMGRLGRERIEGAIADIGVARNPGNTPLLSTRGMTVLKFVADAPNASEYRTLDEAGRRSVADAIDGTSEPLAESFADIGATNAEGIPGTEPRDLDVEWFASPADMCRTMAYLADLAERPGLEPIGEILEIGAESSPLAGDRWTRIRFKGGSEPGVAAGAWWLEDAEGRRYVVAGALNDPDTAMNTVQAVFALAAGARLL